MTPYEPPTHLDLLLDGLPGVALLVGLVALWMGAWAWWRRREAARQARDRAWLHSHDRGGDPRP